MMRRRDVEKDGLVLVQNDDDDSSIDQELPVPQRRRCFWCFEFLIVFLLLCGMAEYLSLEWLQHEDAVMANATRAVKFNCPPTTAELPHAVAVNKDDALSYLNATFEKVKEAMRPFVKEYTLPHLSNNGDGLSIYESSIGNGWNLHVTLELLQERDEYSALPNIMVYGNDPDAEKIASANKLLQPIQQAYDNLPFFQIGSICQADSTNLSHVPSNAFDIVVTGHLQLKTDPLGSLKADDTTKLDADERYRQLCEMVLGENNDGNTATEIWMANELHSILQQRQEDWIGQWVAEMTRIAKPGAPIILEHVSSASFCDAIPDEKALGGVARQFWKSRAATNTYGWNADSESVVIQDDALNASRYHVFMLKKR